MAQAVDEYWEYTRIVGGDDGGKLFTPEEYEKYKRDVIPMRLKNRLYVSWTNSSGMDCKLIGPETLCFCMHRYRQHKTDFKEIPKKRPIEPGCREKGCRCSAYNYLPWSSGGPIRCTCKHTGKEHSEAGNHPCKNDKCPCKVFTSSYTCSCTEAYSQHKMIVETKSERQKRGKPVGQDLPYQAMGGITGFSSLLDGYMRMDSSGRGILDKEVLEQDMSDQDNPFLRAYKDIDNMSSSHNPPTHRQPVAGRRRTRSAAPASRKKPTAPNRNRSSERK